VETGRLANKFLAVLNNPN